MLHTNRREVHKQSTRICGVRLDRLTLEELRSRLNELLDTPGFHHVVTPNPEFVVEALRNPAFFSVLDHASLALPDGMGLVLAEAALHHRRLIRHTGVDTIELLAELADERGLRMGLLGGANGVASAAAHTLMQRFVGLNVRAFEGLGEVHVPAKLDQEIMKRIESYAPHILLVALGSPKQDLWIHYAKSGLEGRVRLAMGVGGSLDYLSGTVQRAPRWMRHFGFEWLYRGFMQPRRFRRLLRATVVFPFLVLKAKLRS